jgi:hypothetical protein
MAKKPESVNDCPDCDVAERQLDRIQSFFPRIDTRASALFAIAVGELAIAAVNVQFDDFKLWYVAVPAALFALLIIAAFVFLYLCAYPSLKGGTNSLIYFREIAKLTEAEYVRRYTSYVHTDRLNDLSGQIWRNAQIASLKYEHLKSATVLLIASIIPWIATLLATSLTHWTTPAVS